MGTTEILSHLYWFQVLMKILSCEGATLTVILRIPITESVVLSACVAVFYTLIGGLYAVAYTDVIQLCSIMVGLVRPSMSMTECLVLAPFFANLFVKSAIVNFVKKIMQIFDLQSAISCIFEELKCTLFKNVFSSTDQIGNKLEKGNINNQLLHRCSS